MTGGGRELLSLSESWLKVGFWRSLAIALGVVALALWVAAIVARDPPDFAERPVIAVLRDAGERPVWAIRLARRAHQIAVDSLAPTPPPSGKVYRLWLAAQGGVPAQPLGLLPLSGRKVIAEIPANVRRLAETGELLVTLEPVNGPLVAAPDSPPVFRAKLDQPG
jgi:anti-sigma-K factor RskA